MIVNLVTFMTDSKFGKENYYVNSVRRLFESSKKFGVEHFHLYTPKSLPVSDYILNFMHDTSEHGFGYYSWKPIIILDVMNKISDGDVILYHDAGREEYNYEFKKDFNFLINDVVKNHGGVGIPVGPFKHKQYCKRDCFINMNCNEERYWNLTQVSANWSIWQKNSLSLKLLNEWKDNCLDPRGTVTTHSTSGPLSDFSDYIEHRHDQAILTNLANKYAFEDRGIGLLTTVGWEKDINNFINVPLEIKNSTSDYSKIKTPHIVDRDEITLVIDVFYSNNKLKVLTTGAVKYVLLNRNTQVISPTYFIDDPHKNVHYFEFDIEYTSNVKLDLIGYDTFIDSSDMNFKIEKDYYGDVKVDHVLTAVCHTDINKISSIATFVKYHLNLGINKIILHENGGSKLYELYDALRPFIENGSVELFKWPIKFYQALRKEMKESPANIGEVSHMNHSLHLFSEAKYLTGLNIDELLVPPRYVMDINEYLDDLVKENNYQDAGGLSIMPNDFRSNKDDVQYYKSTELIENVNNGPKVIYFVKNVNMVSCHVITSGNQPISIEKDVLTFNHYPSLDSNRTYDNIIGYLDNINYSLLED